MSISAFCQYSNIVATIDKLDTPIDSNIANDISCLDTVKNTKQMINCGIFSKNVVHTTLYGKNRDISDGTSPIFNTSSFVTK